MNHDKLQDYLLTLAIFFLSIGVLAWGVMALIYTIGLLTGAAQ